MACEIRSPQEVCQNFEHEAPTGGYAAWTLYQVNDTVTINKAVTTIGNTAVMYYEIPKVVVPCVAIPSGEAVTYYDEGCKVYFDATNSQVTRVAGGNVLCGIVTKAGSVGDETIEIHLMGALAIVA